MPNILDPNRGSSVSNVDLANKDFGYEYPVVEGKQLNLRPGTVLHEKLVKEIMARARDSYSCMQQRHKSWNAVDETLTAYVPLSEEEERVKGKDERKPVSVVIPMSYAVLDTLITYMVTTYLTEDILFKYSPVSPEDLIGAFLLEQAIAQQCHRAKAGLTLHTMWRDSLAYGMGVVTPVWFQQKGKKRVATPTGFTNSLGEFQQTGEKEEVQEFVKFEGNRLDSIDPYCYLPDPTVAAHEVQKGEFVGWMVHDNYVSLLKKEQSELGFFNCKYVKYIDGKSKLITDDASRRDKHGVRPSRTNDNTLKQVDEIYMYIKLIPKDWGLSNNENPETWVFGVAGDQIIVMASPVELDHDMFPVAVSAPDSDGYSVAPISRLEILAGMQTTIDWLVSSHITNIRKAINDMLIVDPSMINVADLEDPKPGKLVRTRRSMWGKGVKDAIQQLNVSDVTRQHIADATILTDIMQKVGAAPDTMQGIMREGGERRSAAESRGTRTSAFGRVEKMVILSNLQAMMDLGLMMASQTQQFMSQEAWLNITGDWPNNLLAEYEIAPNGMYKLTPQSINVFYDVKITEGSPMNGEYADTWIQLLQLAGSNPELAMKLDIVRMYLHAARLAGAKNVNEFVRKGGSMQAQVMPDAQVQQQVQAGNMVPLQQGGAQ